MPPPNTRHSLPALPPSSLPRRSLGSNSCSAPSLASAAHAIGLTVVSISGSDPLPHPYGEGGGLCGGGDTTGMLRDRCGGDKQNGKSGGRSCSSAVCLGARPRPDTISVSGDGMGSGSGSGSGSGAARGAAIFETRDSEPKDGVLQFSVTRDSLVGLAASWAYDGNASGGWQEDRKWKRT